MLLPPEGDGVAELDEILRLTDDMLACAEHGEWGHLVDLERVRRKKIGVVFSVKRDASSSERVADGIQQLLERDRRIMALCRAGRSEISNNLRQFRRGNRVRNAYGVT